MNALQCKTPNNRSENSFVVRKLCFLFALCLLYLHFWSVHGLYFYVKMKFWTLFFLFCFYFFRFEFLVLRKTKFVCRFFPSCMWIVYFVIDGLVKQHTIERSFDFFLSDYILGPDTEWSDEWKFWSDAFNRIHQMSKIQLVYLPWKCAKTETKAQTMQFRSYYLLSHFRRNKSIPSSGTWIKQKSKIAHVYRFIIIVVFYSL